MKVGTKHWDSYSFFDGERYGSAACVSPSNEVFMVGGVNGTAGSTALLNDVWKLATNRAINCGSYYGPKTACSATTCTGGALGTSTAVSTIWRAPSASGLKCMSSSGVAMTMMGQTVDTRTEDCPCPTCATAPDGSLVANILDGGSYLSPYTEVSVGGSLELKCGIGYTSNGSSFSCVYSTPYLGVFATPYPECAPIVTTTTTAAPATTAAPETTAGAATTTRLENITTYTVKSALTLDFGSLPENVTAESLAADPTFVSNVGASIASGLGVDPSKVTITKITLVSSRLSEAQDRQLQGPKLKVEYELVTTSLAEATAVQETLADPTKSPSFAAAFTTALVEKEAASGRTVVVKEIVPEAATVTSVTTTVVITPAPPPAPGSDPAPAPAPAPAPPPPAPTATPMRYPPAPATAATEEEEESDNGAVIGGAVGGVVGVGVP